MTSAKENYSGPGLLIIWGGGDIHPKLYGRENVASYVNFMPSHRDVIEAQLLEKAVKNKIPVIGVCRGAQLACAAAGGILIQDVRGHGRAHTITTSDGREMITSSLHHQMMYPYKAEHELLAWAKPARSVDYVGLSDEEKELIPEKDGNKVEPEVVHFPEINCLAIQGHPEFMDPQCTFNLYVKELCDHYFKTAISN